MLTASVGGEVKLWTPIGIAKAVVSDEDKAGRLVGRSVEVTHVPESFHELGRHDSGPSSVTRACFSHGGRGIVLAAGKSLRMLDSKLGSPVGALYVGSLRNKLLFALLLH